MDLSLLVALVALPVSDAMTPAQCRAARGPSIGLKTNSPRPAIRPQLVGEIAEDADRMLAEAKEERATRASTLLRVATTLRRLIRP